MSAWILARRLPLLAWALLLYGSLSITNISGDWGSAICGPWGCGPRLQALLACHVAWLVVLTPPAVQVQRFASPAMLVRIAIAVLAISVTAVLGIAIYEYQNWYLTTYEINRAFYAHRIGFVVITTVEVPILQTALLATWLLLSRRTFSSQPSNVLA